MVKKKIVLLVILFSMFFNITLVSAKTLADLKSELASAEAKYGKNQAQKKKF